MNGTKEVAQRMVNAENAFIEIVMERIPCTREQAAKALATMIKLKVVKRHLGVSRYQVVHGAYLEPDALWEAVNYDE